jgi:methylmalonyl-CoA/ethylmalonyl-CoA epimerase
VNIEALDHIVVAVPSLAAVEPWERLGLRLQDARRHPGLGTEARSFFVGEGERMTYVEAIALVDRAEAEASGARGSLLAALERGGGVYRFAFRVSSVAEARTSLGELAGRPYSVTRDDGSPVAEVLPVLETAGLGCDVSLIEYAPGIEARRARRIADGLLAHDLPLRRMDHLAVVAPDLDAATATWGRVLGLEVAGRVDAPGIRIVQLAAGDVMVELISGDSPESPLSKRPPGPVSMAAFEVADLPAAIAQAEARGFTVAPPRTGVLPGTTVTTIPADQFAGLGLQLLAYD